MRAVPVCSIIVVAACLGCFDPTALKTGSSDATTSDAADAPNGTPTTPAPGPGSPGFTPGTNPAVSSAAGSQSPSVRPATPTIPVAPVAEGDESAITTSAEEFQAAFAQDQSQFRADLDRKVVQVSGTIDNIWMEPDATAFLSPATGTEQSLTCRPTVRPWSTLTPGQPVTVKGRCVADGTTLSLAHVLVIESGEPSIETITGVELANEFTSDPDGASDAYFGRFLVVTGEWGGTFSGPSQVNIRGTDDFYTKCVFGMGDKYSDLTVRSASQVRIMGRVARIDGKAIVLEECLPPPPE